LTSDEPLTTKEKEQLREFFSLAAGYEIQGDVTLKHRELFYQTVEDLRRTKVAMNILKMLWSAPMGVAAFYTAFDNLNELFRTRELTLGALAKHNLSVQLREMDASGY
jgi:hypothetical protein